MGRALMLLVAAVAALAAACGGAGADGAATAPEEASTAAPTAGTEPADSGAGPTAATTSVTAAAPTTTTTPIMVSPLNGLETAAVSLLDRRVVAVKIDNHPRARPQSGLQEADAVIEVLGEGVTRFIALFLQSDSGYLGPVRSIRPADSTLLAGLGATLAVSGGQPWIKAVTAERGVPILEEGAAGLYRISTRVAPQNLYADTVALRAAADTRGYEDEFATPLFTFGAWDEPPETTAETVTLDWAPGAQVRWRFAAGRYLRLAAGSPHRWVDARGGGRQLACDVLVVIVGDQYTATPGPGLDGRAVPATDTLGSGGMAIFSGGRVIEGTWERDQITGPFRLFDSQGNPVTVPPGVLWVSIYPDTESFRWE